jgi:hypothetical protein
MKKFSDFKIDRLIKENDEGVIGAPNPLPTPPTGEPMSVIKGALDMSTGVVAKSEPSKFVSKMFESREMAHIYHLQIKGDGSYAGHKALDEYYSSILDLIDELIETYQGQYDIIENYEQIDTNGTNTVDKIQYFIDLAEFIKSTRKVAFLEEDSHLQNVIDEMVGLVYRTLYKLKNLK